MKCPGQDSRFWGPEAIYESTCPKCGGALEFFKDESSRKCRRCGEKILNPKMDFGCAAYCKFAAQCLGNDMPPELLAKRTDLLKDRVSAEVKKFLGRNFKRIGRALKIVEYAGRLQKSEGGDPAIVTLAGFLSAISAGLSGTNGNAGVFTHEDLATAESILSRTGAPDELSSEVLAILKDFNGKSVENSVNFRCVHDAIRIADLAEALKGKPALTGNEAFDEPFLTGTGRVILTEVLDQSSSRS